MDPVELVVSYVKDIKATGVMRTRSVVYYYLWLLITQIDRYIYRLVPVSDSTVANVPEIETLCQKVFSVFFNKHPNTKYTVSYIYISYCRR